MEEASAANLFGYARRFAEDSDQGFRCLRPGSCRFVPSDGGSDDRVDELRSRILSRRNISESIRWTAYPNTTLENSRDTAGSLGARMPFLLLSLFAQYPRGSKGMSSLTKRFLIATTEILSCLASCITGASQTLLQSCTRFSFEILQIYMAILLAMWFLPLGALEQTDSVQLGVAGTYHAGPIIWPTISGVSELCGTWFKNSDSLKPSSAFQIIDSPTLISHLSNQVRMPQIAGHAALSAGRFALLWGTIHHSAGKAASARRLGFAARLRAVAVSRPSSRPSRGWAHSGA